MGKEVFGSNARKIKKVMAYNEINKLKRYQKIQEITNKEYEPGYNTLMGVWKKSIYPVFMISYNHYLKILGEGGLKARIEKEEEKVRKDKELFEDGEQ